MILRFLLITLVVAAILATAMSYLFRRLTRTFSLRPRPRRALGVFLGVAAVLVVGVRALGWLPQQILAALGTVAYTVMLAALITAVLLGGVDLALILAARAARVFLRRAVTPPAPDTSPAPAPAAASPAAPPLPETLAAIPRRDFLAQATAGSAMAVGVGSSVYGTLVGRHDYAIVDVPSRLPGLSRRLDGYTIVQLSDIHIGTFVGEPELRAAEDLVRRARPDLLVLTGDLVDHDPRYAGDLGRFVRRLSGLARDGVVVVPGNHDYYAGLPAVRAAVTGAGATMLINEGRVIGDSAAGFALLGVDDLFGPRSDAESPGPDLDRAIASVPADLPRVLLCHNPQLFPQAVGKVALQLSGHTHGGQIHFGLPMARVVLGHPFIAGAYRLGETGLYVNRGFGTAGPPARIGAPPEVSRIILTA